MLGTLSAAAPAAAAAPRTVAMASAANSPSRERDRPGRASAGAGTPHDVAQPEVDQRRSQREDQHALRRPGQQEDEGAGRHQPDPTDRRRDPHAAGELAHARTGADGLHDAGREHGEDDTGGGDDQSRRAQVAEQRLPQRVEGGPLIVGMQLPPASDGAGDRTAAGHHDPDRDQARGHERGPEVPHRPAPIGGHHEGRDGREHGGADQPPSPPRCMDDAPEDHQRAVVAVDAREHGPHVARRVRRDRRRDAAQRGDHGAAGARDPDDEAALARDELAMRVGQPERRGAPERLRADEPLDDRREDRPDREQVAVGPADQRVGGVVGEHLAHHRLVERRRDALAELLLVGDLRMDVDEHPADGEQDARQGHQEDREDPAAGPGRRGGAGRTRRAVCPIVCGGDPGAPSSMDRDGSSSRRQPFTQPPRPAARWRPA